MGRILRIAIPAVTLMLVAGSFFRAALGHQDIAVVFALGAALGVSALGFARADHPEAAVALLSLAMVAVASLTLAMSPLGFHDHAAIAYAGVLLFCALLLSRKGFLAMAAVALGLATLVFACERLGLTQSKLGMPAGWPTYFGFLLVTAVVGGLGRVVAEILFGALGEAQRSSMKDAATGLDNRARFLSQLDSRLRGADRDGFGVLVLADIEGFRHVNGAVGHAAGDRILAECARRAAAAWPGSLVGRVGDDEFALLAPGLRSAGEAAHVAAQLQEALTLEHLGVSVRVAVGHAVFPRDGRSPEALWTAADASLGEARQQPRGRPGAAT